MIDMKMAFCFLVLQHILSLLTRLLRIYQKVSPKLPTNHLYLIKEPCVSIDINFPITAFQPSSKSRTQTFKRFFFTLNCFKNKTSNKKKAYEIKNDLLKSSFNMN